MVSRAIIISKHVQYPPAKPEDIYAYLTEHLINLPDKKQKKYKFCCQKIFWFEGQKTKQSGYFRAKTPTFGRGLDLLKRN